MALYIVGMTTAYDDINPTGSINDQLAQLRAVLNVEILSMATDRQLDEVEAGIARAQQALDQLCAIHESSTRYLDLTVQRLASRLAAAEGPYRAADMARF